MKEVAVLLIALMNQGHWFADRDNAVALRWLLETPMPASTLYWELALGNAVLSRGSSKLEAGEKGASRSIMVSTPEVRVRTRAQWRWRLVDDTGRLVCHGDENVVIYPDHVMSHVARIVGDKRVVVFDITDALPEALDKAGVSYVRIDHLSDLSTMRMDVLLVGPDAIEDLPFIQQPLIGAAQSGASVMVLRQRKTRNLGGYPLATKSAPPALKWRDTHPLLSGLEPEALTSWLDDVKQRNESLTALVVPGDAPAMEVAWWPYEQEDAPPATIDALLLTQTFGQGRVVYCQLPPGSWVDDPRAAMFLCGALGYLASPAQPTLPLNKRRAEASTSTDVPMQSLFRGENP